MGILPLCSIETELTLWSSTHVHRKRKYSVGNLKCHDSLSNPHVSTTEI